MYIVKRHNDIERNKYCGSVGLTWVNNNTHKCKYTSVHNIRQEKTFCDNTNISKHLKQLSYVYHRPHHSYIKRNIEHEKNKVFYSIVICSISCISGL